MSIKTARSRIEWQSAAIFLWLLLLVLMLIIYAWTLKACGIWSMFGRLDRCPVAASANPALDTERYRQDELEREIDRLELALLERPICELPSEPAAPPPVDEPEQAMIEEPELAEEPLPACPADRRRSTEVVLVLDTSPSMKYDFALDPEIEAELMELVQGPAGALDLLLNNPNADPMAQLFGGLLGGMMNVDPARQRRLMELQGLLDQPNLPNRIDIAKSSLRKLVEASASEVEFAFVTFDECNQPLDAQRYGTGERAALLGDIGRAQLGNYTALAQTIAALPSVISGGRSEERPVNVVLVSDGEDSCNGDPCAAAESLKSQLPHAFVNSIAISRDTREAQCIATATGGTFVAADDSSRLADQLVRAAGQDLPEHCR